MFVFVFVDIFVLKYFKSRYKESVHLQKMCIKEEHMKNP